MSVLLGPGVHGARQAVQGRFLPLIVANCSAALLAFMTQAALAADAAPAAASAEAQLRAIDQRVVAAWAAQDPAAVEALVGSDFRMIDRNGARVDRSSFLAAMAQPGGLRPLSHDEVRVRLFDTVALLHGVVQAHDGARPLRLRYTHVFHWQAERWQLVAAQSTPLREGVATTLQQAVVAPQVPAWTGRDPVGVDTEVLRQLNEQYVRAFREADVSWYDAHLAADYVVTQGDGAFDYRAGALAAFARPTFATHFRSFPVEQVIIRRFGELALIEADNPYELKDGRTGRARYTDIWQRQPGGWRCIAAHITPVVSG